MGHVYPYWQIMLTKLPDYYFSFMKLIVSTFLVYKVCGLTILVDHFLSYLLSPL